MPAPEGNVSRMTSLSALPSSEGYGVGDIANVKGVLYVLADNNEFHGTAGLDSNEKYLGAIKVEGESAVGLFVDREVKGEVTWVHTDLQGEPAATGVVVATTPIYNGAELGTLRLYLTRNSDNELGCQFDYVPASSSGTGLQLDIGARLTLIYLPFVQ